MNATETVKINRVLALSGGGVKGIAELVILAEIEKRTGKQISELFTIISGTSVGGLIAGLLTIPKDNKSKESRYSASEALKIFKASLPQIFPESRCRTVRQVFTSKYTNKPLIEILDSYLGYTRFNNTTSRLIIPVADLETRDIKAFDSANSYSTHIKTKDILLATTAAPTFFKPITNHHSIGNYTNKKEVGYMYVDGGIGANRPAYEVLKILKSCNIATHSCVRGIASREEQHDVLNKTMIVALNFQDPPERSSQQLFTGRGSIVNWLQADLLSKILSITENNTTLEVRNDLPGDDEFMEILIPLTQETQRLDNARPDNINALEQLAKQYVLDKDNLIQKICDNLLYHYEKCQKQNMVDTLKHSLPTSSIGKSEHIPVGTHTQRYLDRLNNNACIIM